MITTCLKCGNTEDFRVLQAIVWKAEQDPEQPIIVCYKMSSNELEALFCANCDETIPVNNETVITFDHE